MQNCKVPRPTGLPMPINVRRELKPQPNADLKKPTIIVPPLATRRGSLVRPSARLSQARGVKSVQDLANIINETTCIRRTTSYNCMKTPKEIKRKLQFDDDDIQRAKYQATVDTGEAAESCKPLKPPSVNLIAECQKVLQSLHTKVTRNSGDLDDSVASLISECADLEVRLDQLSVASEMADRTPSVEDLPMECEPTTPGQVMSAMSLDTGYQGDGELSRPESRNAESEVRIIKAQDDLKTMTDSDFFTESDADCYDDSGVNKRRDRKAQVIDGTLYGGPVSSQTEDMESSGIYSDFERKPEPPCYQELITQQIQTIQNIVMSQQEKATPVVDTAMVKSSSGDSSSTIQETPTVKVVSPTESGKKETVRKNKMPNRNVESKLKALLASETKTEMKPRVPKRGKWDAVMDKIAAGKEKPPLSSKLREVKSKVFQAVNNPRGGSGNATPNPDVAKLRSRRSTRVRSSESSLLSPKSKQARSTLNSANSSAHSSLSDLSVNVSLKRGSKKGAGIARDHTIVICNRGGDTERSRENHGITKGSQSVNTHSNINGPAARRPTTHRPLNTTALKDVNHNGPVSRSASNAGNLNNNNINSYKTKVVGRAANKNTPSVRPVVARTQTAALRQQIIESNRAVDALATLLNYCTNDLEAFNTPYLKRTLAYAKTKLEVAEEELKNQETVRQRLEDELKETCSLLNVAQTKGATLEAELQTEQSRASAAEGQLREAVENCLKLENNLKEKTTELQDLASKELNYQKRLENLNEVANKFEELVKLKRNVDDSLVEYRSKNDSLAQSLQDRECEVKMLTADNVKLREKISRLSAENKELRSGKNDGDVERTKPLDIKWVESRNRLCTDQRETPKLERLSSFTDTSEQSLLSEVESLRHVLALKTDEVSELHRLELHLRVEADRVPKLLSLVTSLEAKVEDLKSQLSSQNELLRSVQKEKEVLQDELKSENAQKTRLSHKNEELQYKLRVNSEAMWQLVNRNLVEDRSPQCSSATNSPRRFDESRPQMLGVVQKSDSVSYMLDMGEDTAQVVSNIVRRAESARSQTLPKKMRSRTLGSADSPATDYYTCESCSSSPAVTPRRPMRSRACVRLLHSDFTTDSIDLPREADCEVIEITGSFDHPEPDMSCSTSSNSSGNFDIESEVYAESPVMIPYECVPTMEEKRLDPEGQDFAHLIESQSQAADEEAVFPTPFSLPAVGEAMVSSDED